MDAATELGAVVRRLPPSAYERLLLLLHCLVSSHTATAASSISGSTAAGDDGTSPSPLSLESMCALLLAACPGRCPRFLFALGSTDKLLRSPDRGQSWRVSFTRSTAPVAHAEGGGSDVLTELRGLLTAGEGGPPPLPSEDAAADTGSLCCAHGYGDVVALCGRDGVVAVSADRGVTFTTTAASSLLGEGAALQHVCVLDSHRLAVSDGRRVAVVRLEHTGYGRLSLGKTTVALVCDTAVSLLRAYTTAGEGRRALVVGEHNRLHLSLDGGASFLEARHCLGSIRDVDSMAALRRSQQPHFPAAQLSAALELGDGSSTTPSSSAAPAPAASSPYSYVCGYKADDASCRSRKKALDDFAAAARRHGDDVFVQHFFVVGSGAEVLPYDYSAVLCLCVRRLPSSRAIVVTCATHVRYIPFSRSRRHDKLLCRVVRGVGTGAWTAVRGSSVGVSASSDWDRWDTPHGAAPVGLAAVAGGAVISCGRNKVVSVLGGTAGAGAEVCTIPSELRVPFLLDAFTM